MTLLVSRVLAFLNSDIQLYAFYDIKSKPLVHERRPSMTIN